MNTNILTLASSLSDHDLLARVVVLAAKEREASAELVAHLAALDARPALYAAEGHGSLFTYCTDVLRLSEDAACNRIQAARACRDFPMILDLLASGAMSLTRPHGASAPHAGEPRSRARQGPWPKPARDRGPGGGVGTTTRCPLFRPETSNGYASAHAHTRRHATGGARRGGHAWGFRTGATGELSTAATDNAPSGDRDHFAGALPCPVH